MIFSPRILRDLCACFCHACWSEIRSTRHCRQPVEVELGSSCISAGISSCCHHRWSCVDAAARLLGAGSRFWFAQTDSIFAALHCAKCHKYDYCLAHPPSSIISTFEELSCYIRTGAVDDPWKQLEAKLSSSYQMLGLLPHDVIPNRLFLVQFLCWLPANMQDQLAA